MCCLYMNMLYLSPCWQPTSLLPLLGSLSSEVVCCVVCRESVCSVVCAVVCRHAPLSDGWMKGAHLLDPRSTNLIATCLFVTLLIASCTKPEAPVATSSTFLYLGWSLSGSLVFLALAALSSTERGVLPSALEFRLCNELVAVLALQAQTSC